MSDVTPSATASSVGPRWLVRVGVYVMLVASAVGTLVLNDRLWGAARGGNLPVWGALVPPITFTAFVAVYAVDRWLLVRRRGYPLTRAFFQLALAVVFLTVLWPQQALELKRTRAQAQGLELGQRLLTHREADVRAAACELVALKTDLSALAQVETLAKTDNAAVVRGACEQAATRLRAMGAQ